VIRIKVIRLIDAIYGLTISVFTEELYILKVKCILHKKEGPELVGLAIQGEHNHRQERNQQVR